MSPWARAEQHDRLRLNCRLAQRSTWTRSRSVVHTRTMWPLRGRCGGSRRRERRPSTLAAPPPVRRCCAADLRVIPSCRSDAPPSFARAMQSSCMSRRIRRCLAPARRHRRQPPARHATLAAAVGVGCGQERASRLREPRPLRRRKDHYRRRPHSRRSTSSLASLAHPSSIVWSARRGHCRRRRRTPFPPARRRRRRRRPRPSQQSARRSTSLHPLAARSPRPRWPPRRRQTSRTRPRPRAELRIRRAARPTEHRRGGGRHWRGRPPRRAPSRRAPQSSLLRCRPRLPPPRLARITAAVSSLPSSWNARTLLRHTDRLARWRCARAARAEQRRVERAREPARSGRPCGRLPRVGQFGFARRRRLDDILDDGASVGDEEAGVARADDVARRCEGDAREMEPRLGHLRSEGTVGLVDRRRDVRDLLALVRLG